METTRTRQEEREDVKPEPADAMMMAKLVDEVPNSAEALERSEKFIKLKNEVSTH